MEVCFFLAAMGPFWWEKEGGEVEECLDFGDEKDSIQRERERVLLAEGSSGSQLRALLVFIFSMWKTFTIFALDVRKE